MPPAQHLQPSMPLCPQLRRRRQPESIATDAAGPSAHHEAVKEVVLCGTLREHLLAQRRNLSMQLCTLSLERLRNIKAAAAVAAPLPPLQQAGARCSLPAAAARPLAVVGCVAAAAVAGGGGTPGDGAAPASMVRAVKFAVADGDDGGDDAPGGSGGPTASRSASAASASGPYGSPHRRGQLKRCKSSLALAHRPEHKLAHLGGVGIFYSDSPTGLPPIMMHFLHNIDAMHEVVIILTVRFLPLPNIAPVERFLVRSIEQLPNFYQVVARYGYQDQIDHGPGFVSNVIATIMHKLELKAGLQYAGLENDYIHELEGGDEEAGQEEPDDADADEEAQTAASAAAAAASMAAALAPPDMYACSSPGGSSHAPSFLSAHQSPYVSKFTLNALERIRVQANADDSPQAVQEALMMAEALVDTVCERVVYYQGRSFTRAKRGTGPVHQLVVGTLYRSLEMIAYNDSEAWSIPLENMVELGIILEI
uniref:K+ potassium transporter C-terminal domain-containing protein n=1 Tax=Chlamydomonas euryale TaxID=1486919 RepID=A0A7R9YVS8_9CHLO|mmetsp:Transcript_28082/g.83209  ORF Transcript_28082/g.83209 Transcript_28082/m.83209 type:complete len:480 (+) Transcript_28082:477-1916(+)